MIRLKPGDYVSTEGMTEEQYHAVCKAFMEAGANKCEYKSGYVRDHKDFNCVGWGDGNSSSVFDSRGIFHFPEWDEEGYFKKKRKLTIDQILGSDNIEGTKEMTLQEAYKVMQANCGIEVGDTVKVLRKAKDDEMARYGLSYQCTMPSSLIGTTVKVYRLYETAIHAEGWNYPFFVLELVKKAPKLPSPIRISSQYKVMFREDGGIDVGCQRLSFDMIEEIYFTAKAVKYPAKEVKGLNDEV